MGPQHTGFNPKGGMIRDLYSNGGVPSDRVSLLRSVDRLRREIDTDNEFLATDTYTDRVLQMLTSTKVRDAFDVKKEPEKIRERYGKGYGGMNLLQALRLPAC